MVLIAVLSSCSAGCFRAKEKSEATSTAGTSTVVASVTETSEPAPMPIPTYAPGTELYGMLSVTGEVVVEPKYEQLYLFTKDGLARFCDHRRWGFVNTDGEEVIPAQYEEANNFSEGLAAVKVDGLWGFIDTTGEMVIEPQVTGVQEGFKYSRCVIYDNQNVGVIDREGKMVIPCDYTEIELTCENYFIARGANSKHSIVDNSGKVLIDRTSAGVFAVTNNGYFFVDGGSSDSFISNFSGEKYYVRHFDPYRMWYAEFDSSFFLQDDSFVVCSPTTSLTKWGLFDLASGDFVSDPVYASFSYWPTDDHVLLYYEDGRTDIYLFEEKRLVHSEYYVGDHAGGYLIVIEDDKYGVTDLDGNIVLDTRYEYITKTTKTGEFSVHEGEMRGILTASGKGPIPLQSQYIIYEYHEELSMWEIELHESVDGFGFMSPNGEVIYEPQFYIVDWSWNPTGQDGAGAVIVSDSEFRYKLLTADGYATDDFYADMVWYAKTDVIIFTASEGSMGLMNGKGEILFETSDCRILPLNDKHTHPGIALAEGYDTDYVLYVGEAS